MPGEGNGLVPSIRSFSGTSDVDDGTTCRGPSNERCVGRCGEGLLLPSKV